VFVASACLVMSEVSTERRDCGGDVGSRLKQRRLVARKTRFERRAALNSLSVVHDMSGLASTSFVRLLPLCSKSGEAQERGGGHSGGRSGDPVQQF